MTRSGGEWWMGLIVALMLITAITMVILLIPPAIWLLSHFMTAILIPWFHYWGL